MKKFLIALMAVALLLPVASVAPVAAAGLCSAAAHDYYHIVVHRYADDPYVNGTYMEYVSSETNARDLDVCVGSSPGQGATFILGANIQHTDGRLMQLGYGQRAGDSTERFFYALGDPPTAVPWPTPFTLTYGHTYKFEIIRGALIGSPGYVRFKITDKTTGSSSYLDKSWSWSTGYTLAWWGAETWDSASDHGSDDSNTTILRYLCYRTESMGACTYRSGMTSSDVYKSSGVPTNHHGHITDWSYGGDALHVETH